MGITITPQGVVSLSDMHEDHVVTCPLQKAKAVHIKSAHSGGETTVYCLFQRIGLPISHQSSTLALALKEIGGFKMPREDKVDLCRRSLRIGQRIEAFADVDAIVPIPSSHDIVGRMCRLAHRALPRKPPILAMVRKATVAEVLHDRAPTTDLPSSLRDAYRKELERLRRCDPKECIASKRIPVRLRRFVTTIRLNEACPRVRSGKLLLIDDLVSTGCTFQKRCGPSLRGIRQCPYRGVGPLGSGDP